MCICGMGHDLLVKIQMNNCQHCVLVDESDRDVVVRFHSIRLAPCTFFSVLFQRIEARDLESGSTMQESAGKEDASSVSVSVHPPQQSSARILGNIQIYKRHHRQSVRLSWDQT